MKACVVGLGRAGLPLAAVIADSGIEVIGYDIDEARVEKINGGENPIPEEQGLSELLKKHAGKNLRATADIRDAVGANVYIVIVPLFLDSHNNPDFTILQSAFESVATVLSDGDLVVLETTVPPGTTDTFVKPILDGCGKKYLLAYSPERIMTGVSISRIREFPKVVGGVDRQSMQAAYMFYSQFSKKVEKVDSAKAAELVKVAEGIYRDVNISLANELFRVCDELGVDFWQMRSAASHQFCDIHEPGMVGGHCIPVYPHFLIKEYDVPLIKLARNLNEKMVGYYAKKASSIAGEKGSIAIVGLSYRSGVKETHHTQSHKLIKALNDLGHKVFGFDESFTDDEIRKYFKIEPAPDLSKMDAVIVVNKIEKIGVSRDKIVDVKQSLE